MRSALLILSVLAVGCAAPEPYDGLDDDTLDPPGGGLFDDDDDDGEDDREPVPLGADLAILDVGAGILENGVIHGHVAHLAPWLQRQGEDIAGLVVVNDGDRDAEVDVTVRLPDYADPVTRRFDVPADGDAYAYYLSPDLDLGAIYDLRSQVTTNLTMVVEADGDRISEQLPIDIIPRTRMPWRVESSDGEIVSVAATLATFVQPDSDAVREVIAYARDIVSDGNMAGYQGTNDVYDEVNAVWETMYEFGIGYSNIPGSLYDGAQRVRLHDEVLYDGGANCVDGAIFFAAVFEQLGMRPLVFLNSGHAWVGVYLSNPDTDPNAEYIAIETTSVGDDNAYLDDAVDAGFDTTTDSMENDPAFDVLDIVDLHRAGIVPMPY